MTKLQMCIAAYCLLNAFFTGRVYQFNSDGWDFWGRLTLVLHILFGAFLYPLIVIAHNLEKRKNR
jgi:hypothetical protein